MNDPRIKLLLIEDEASLIGVIEDMLAQASPPGFTLVAVNTLAQGRQRLAGGDIDLALLDLVLPDSQGIESLNQLHAQAPNLPIIVLTGLEDEALALRALREGAQDYLLKGELRCPALVRAIRYAIERKRGEEARSRLAAIVESSRDAIIGMSLEGLIVSWNPGAEQLFGYAFEDVVGRPIGMLVPPDRPDEMPVILEWLKRGDFIKDFETVRLRKDQRPVHVAASVSPIKDNLGKIIGASLIARNIEERIRAEQEREALVRHLQETLAQVKTLSGLLPICASCKKIRDDQGYWTQVEVYVRDRSQADFTHGICPDCAQAYRAQLTKKA